MTTFDIGDLHIPTFHDEQQGDGLTRIQWRNGAPQLRTAGRFFVPADRLPDGLIPGEPWQPTTEVFESGDEVEGYAAEELPLLILCVRSQPFYKDAADAVVWLDRWERGRERQSMSAEVLCIARGLEDLGPVVWSSRTVKTSFAIISRGDKGNPPGIVHAALNSIVKPASKAAGRALDLYCFWLTVGSEKDGKGKVVYTEAGSRKVTRPVLRLPAEPTLEYARSLWAGTAYIGGTLAPLREQYEGWRQERRTNDESDAQPQGRPAGRNVPQPLSDDDYGVDDVI